MKPTREEALELLLEYNESEALIQHAKQVEAAMMHFASYFGEDVEKWGIVGLCHDLDYEKYPEEHCIKTKEILEENNWPEEYIRAIISHGWDSCVDVKPESLMEKTLYTIDELTGIINAACLLRPSKSVLDLKLKSLNKKFKDKKFAAGCDRDIILNGIDMLEIDKNIIFEETIKGLQERAEECGLKGNL
ncbi:HDIG domain-containing metalloprotein [Peptoniphilus stercorisuis]|uniref:Nucleotidyltransferase with HDIG domain n=1 Tax=Peptoniphilus stercorisuis TaxID=1436965 RepID=A0ABS4KEW0_9FIRM|nr:HDIG domain-containing metalloprotein [Peptoniphilus stercorisuis]MBP2025821.1 putative nucleotidyltransferase with HDIG domain [Peptoniphilus stercorisuis]